MDIRMTGLGSGFDIDKLVKAYIDAEKVPQEALMNNKRTRLESQLSAFGQLESQASLLNQTLTELSKTDIYSGKNYTLETTDYFTATVANDANIGMYDIQVQKIAQASTLATPAEVFLTYPSIPANPGDPIAETPNSMDPDTSLGASGSLTVKVNGMGQAITITSDMTLQDISREINQIEMSTPFVQTSLVAAAKGTQLMLASEALGEDYKISLDVVDDDISGNAVLTQLFGDPSTLAEPLKYDPATDPASDYGIQELRAGEDAEFTINGIQFKKSSNSLKDVMPGLNLELNRAHNVGDLPTRMSVYLDQTQLLELVYTFVDQHNATTTQIKDYSFAGLNEESRGPLAGDYLANSLKRALEIRGTVSSSGISLGTIGIQYNQYGFLEVDQQKLTDALADEDLDVSELFLDADQGVAVTMQKTVDAFIRMGGSFDARVDTINQSLEDLVDQQEQLDEMIAAREAMLYQKFNLMDEIMDRMEKTRENLKNLFDTLPTNSKNKD